jgi:hypothetical protein
LPASTGPIHTQDYNYRLWGTLANGTSCAYKAPDGTPLYYPGYHRSSWEGAPACSGAPTDPGASPRDDTEGRQWGWENDAPCAYKDAASPGTGGRGKPAAGPAPRPANASDQWPAAPACSTAPNRINAVEVGRGAQSWDGWRALTPFLSVRGLMTVS